MVYILCISICIWQVEAILHSYEGVRGGSRWAHIGDTHEVDRIWRTLPHHMQSRCLELKGCSPPETMSTRLMCTWRVQA